MKRVMPVRYSGRNLNAVSHKVQPHRSPKPLNRSNASPRQCTGGREPFPNGVLRGAIAEVLPVTRLTTEHDSGVQAGMAVRPHAHAGAHMASRWSGDAAKLCPVNAAEHGSILVDR